MIVTRGIENIANATDCVATLGSYDGIHLGHQDILHTLLEKKKAGGFSRSVVLTFDPHPQEVLRKNNTSIHLLTTIDERLELLESFGIDEVVVIAFSREFYQTPYSEFFHSVLVSRLGVKEMVVGNNHAFGKNREGDVAHLRSLATTVGVGVTEVMPRILDGIEISSTKIRHALESGDVATASTYLGRNYELRGTVISGDKLGRTIGYPTANIRVAENKLVPKDGVYAAMVVVDGQEVLGALSIGTRPTVTSGGERVIEVVLLDYENELYGATISIKLISFLREQIAFDSLELLRLQIDSDVLAVRQLVSLA